MSAVRLPAVAGQFYAADGRELARQVEACFIDWRGPGELPVRHRAPERRLAAAVVPHAGLPYSGAIAAHVYERIARGKAPPTVVLLGVDHYGASRRPALSAVPWGTPLGPVPIDTELVRILSEGPFAVDEGAHAREHSIEVQLPFLQYVLPKPRIVPVEVPFGPLPGLEAVGRALAQAVADRDVLLLASTDFSHYVPAEEARRLDRRAIDAILARDPDRLYRTVVGERISMCGIAPTTALLAALRGRAVAATLLRWGHSGEVAPMEEVVGYAAIALETEPAARPVK